MTVCLLLGDEPEEGRERLWPGLQLFARELSQLLCELPETSPVLVTGDWGAGKTTLLNALRSEVGRERTIWFEAWRHEGEGLLLPALVRATWKQFPAQLRKREEAKSLFKQAWQAAVVAGLRLAPYALSAAGFGPLGEALKWIGASPLKRDLDAVSGDEVLPSEAPSELLRKQFAKLIAAGWPSEDAHPPVVIIDDLDRCTPDVAVTLLEQIRALLAPATSLNEPPPRCRFIAAMDRDVLVQAISKKFEGIANYDGNRYLEKVFPHTFVMPTPGRAEAAKLIGNWLVRDGVPQDSDELEHQDALSAALTDPLFANPRLMKRCINRYRLVIRFEQKSQELVEPLLESPHDENRLLAKWIAATAKWPALRRAMRQYREEYWSQIGRLVNGEGGECSPDPTAARLLDEPGVANWLRREVFANTNTVTLYRSAERRLLRWGL